MFFFPCLQNTKSIVPHMGTTGYQLGCFCPDHPLLAKARQNIPFTREGTYFIVRFFAHNWSISYQVNVFTSRIHKAMNKESKHKDTCDDNKHDEHTEFQPPTPLVLGDVELDEDDAVGNQGDEDKDNHTETPGFKGCQT